MHDKSIHCYTAKSYVASGLPRFFSSVVNELSIGEVYLLAIRAISHEGFWKTAALSVSTCFSVVFWSGAGSRD